MFFKSKNRYGAAVAKRPPFSEVKKKSLSLLNEYKKSNLSIKAFCIEKNIARAGYFLA